MNQGSSAPGRIRGRIHEMVDVFQASRGQSPAHHFDAARNPLQQVIEIMRNTTRQLANRLHFLALAQALLSFCQGQRRLPLQADIAAYCVNVFVVRNRTP